MPTAQKCGKCGADLLRHQGRITEADTLYREGLARVVEIATTRLPKLEEGDLCVLWGDWIVAQARLREANALIEGSGGNTNDFRVKE